MSEITEPPRTLLNSFSSETTNKRLIIPPTSHFELSLDSLKEFCKTELETKGWQPGEDTQYRKLLLQGEHLSFGLAIFPPSDKDEDRHNWFECYSNCKVHASIKRDISRSKPKAMKPFPEFVKTNAKLQSARYVFKKENNETSDFENKLSDCILFLFQLPLEQNNPHTRSSASFLHVSFYNEKQSRYKFSAQNVPRLKFLQNKLDAPTFSFASTIYKSSLQHHDNIDLPIIEITQQMSEFHLQNNSQSNVNNSSNLVQRKFFKNDGGVMIDRNNSIIEFVESSLATSDTHKNLEEHTTSSRNCDQFDLASFDWPIEILNPFTIECSWHNNIAYLELKNNTNFQNIVIEKVFIRDHAFIQSPDFPMILNVDESIGMAFSKFISCIDTCESDSETSSASLFKLKGFLSFENKLFRENNIRINDVFESQCSHPTVSIGIKWYFNKSLNSNWSQIDFSSTIQNEILEVSATDGANSSRGDSISILITNHSFRKLQLYISVIFSNAFGSLKDQIEDFKNSPFSNNLVEIGSLGPGLSKVKRINLPESELNDNCLPTILVWETNSKFYFVFNPSNYAEY